MLDTYRSVETPEGVELGLRVAGPGARALAWGFDALIRLGIYLGASIPLAVLGQAGVGLYLLLIFFVEWFYPVFFEVLRGGATPGKRRLGLQVLHDDGTPVGWSAATVRNLVRFADFLPIAYAAGLATMLVHRDFKRLGDLAAGTVVVHRDEPFSAPQLEPGPATPPPAPLTLEEQRAVIEFAHRQESWTPQRAAELAGYARALTGQSGRDGVAALLAVAHWLVGRRRA